MARSQGNFRIDLLRNHQLLFTMAASFYTFTSNIGGFYLLHILSSIGNFHFKSFYYSHPNGDEVESHCGFDFHFLNGHDTEHLSMYLLAIGVWFLLLFLLLFLETSFDLSPSWISIQRPLIFQKIPQNLGGKSRVGFPQFLPFQKMFVFVTYPDLTTRKLERCFIKLRKPSPTYCVLSQGRRYLT